MALSSLLQKLLFVNQYNVKNGRIEILGTPFIMLDASDILVLQEIDKTKMYNSVKKSSRSNMKKIVQHAQVYKNIKGQSLMNIANLSKKIAKSDEGMIKTLQDFFDVYGLGKLEIIDLNNQEKSAMIRIEKSTLASEQLKIKKTGKCVCTLTAALLAGIFSYIFDKDVDCVEKTCLAKGDEACDFEVS
ncbi:hypothetical protein GF386_01000 [Candidatus Pacearchaeota archaeon]|nr:hypothetical protein [Candidatus Pacearchaeota archaeon]MBD3282813.1 hypothetical protein [Candidatus Pacearchaeota archaeon]